MSPSNFSSSLPPPNRWQPQLGQNKAQATAALIADLFPTATIEVVSRYLDSVACAALVPRADIVLNTIDLDTPAFVDLYRAARAAGKPVLFPVNPIWMGTVIVFTPDSQSLDDFLGITDPAERLTAKEVTSRLFERIYEQVPGGMPAYLRELLHGYFDEDPASERRIPPLGAPNSASPHI